MTKPVLLFFLLSAIAFGLIDTWADRAMSRRVEALEARPVIADWRPSANELAKLLVEAIATNNGAAWAWTPKPSRTNAPVDLIPDDELIPPLRVDHWPLTTNWTGIAIIHTNRTKVGIGQRSDGVLVWREAQ